MQQRLRNYEHALLSFEHNSFNLGLHSPGRYMGFDVITSPNGLSFSLGHSGLNFQYRDPNNTVIGPIGVFLTKQGTIIMETADIGTFSVDSNQGNTFIRYDIVYAMHHQVEIAGGQAATYGIQKGAFGTSDFPILNNPEDKIILGYVGLNPGASDMSNCFWVKAKCPDSGDGEDARINDVNLFTKFQGFALAPVLSNTDADVYINGGNKGYWTLPNTGNTFRIYPPITTSGEVSHTLSFIKWDKVKLVEGQRINILINSAIQVTGNIDLLRPEEKAQGYRGFIFDIALANIVPNTTPIQQPPGFPSTGGSQQFPHTEGIRPSSGSIWEIEAIFMDDIWRIVQVKGSGSGKIFSSSNSPYTDNIAQVINQGSDSMIYVPRPVPRILYAGIFTIGIPPAAGGAYTIILSESMPHNQYLVIGGLGLPNSGSLGGLNQETANTVWLEIGDTKAVDRFQIYVKGFASTPVYFNFILISNT